MKTVPPASSLSHHVPRIQASRDLFSPVMSDDWKWLIPEIYQQSFHLQEKSSAYRLSNCCQFNLD
jgi:hypothetical protein